MPEQPLTADEIIAQAHGDVAAVKAGMLAALVEVEELWAKHQAALEEAQQLLGLYQSARERAEQAGALHAEAMARFRAREEALSRIAPVDLVGN